MKKSWIPAILAVVLLLGVFIPSSAQTLNIRWEVIRESVSKTNYANLVILPDGFTAGDQLEKEFPIYVRAILDTLDEQARYGGWSKDWSKVRIILAKIPSEQSGVSNPSKGVTHNTFFGSFLRKGDEAINLSDEGYQKAVQVLSSVPGGYDTGLYNTGKDMAVLVVNDVKGRGSFLNFFGGGQFYYLATTTVYTRPDKLVSPMYTVTHEWGRIWNTNR